MKRLLLIAALVAPAAQAATFTVTRLDDPVPDACFAKDCSLREAILAANGLRGFDTVVLGAGRHQLRQLTATTPLTAAITDNIALQGAGRALTHIEGRGRGSLFTVNGAEATFASLALSKGDASGGAFGSQGGAIRATQAPLTLRDVRVFDNHAVDGGGIHAIGESVTMIDSVVDYNDADNDGGGLHVDGILQLGAASSIRSNVAGHWGGGVHAVGLVTGEDDCDISDNAAKAGGGVASMGAALELRGIAKAGGDGLFDIELNTATDFSWLTTPIGYGGGVGSQGNTVIERVRFFGNESNFLGGGVGASGGTVSVRDSQFVRNVGGGGGMSVSTTSPILIERTAFEDNLGYYGAALQLNSATVDGTPPIATLRNVDFHGNQADYDGVVYNASVLTLSHVTFWNNTDIDGAATVWQKPGSSTTYANSVMLGRCRGSIGAFVASGYNIVSSESANGCMGNLPTAPLALSRGNFGGLFDVSGTSDPASGLRDVGSAPHCVGDDIRARVRDSSCDAGAFEYLP